MSDESALAGRVPEPAASVNDQITAQLVLLDSIAQTPLADQADIYQQVHIELQGALAEIESA